MWERGLKLDKHSTKKKKYNDKGKNHEPEKNNLRPNREVEKKYPTRNREVEKKYPTRNHEVKKDKNPKSLININNNNDFPVFNEVKKVEDKKEEEPKSNIYAEMCKKTNDEDERRKKERFQPGCIGFRYDKKTHKTTYTRDGINYYPMEKYHEECRIKEEKRSMERWIQSLDEMEQRYETESRLHYEMYGELDGYALAKIEHAKYNEYAKQFEIELEDPEIISDYDEEYYDSDLSSVN